MAQYPATDSMGRDYDNPDYNKEGGYAGRGGNDNRIKTKDFLNTFATGVNKSMAADRDRSSNTEAAQGRSSSSKDRDKKIQTQIASLGSDISVQEGLRASEDMIPGTPGKKGILGHAARGVGMAFAPATMGLSMAAGNFAGDRLDYV